MNVEKLLKLAKAGDIDAKYQLGRLAEEDGQIDEAKKWFHEAAAGGSPAAMNAIGLLAHTAGDLIRARNWYEKAANNGYSMALNNLGTVSEDPEEARKWLEAGVKAGNSLAMFNLGLILQESGEEKQASELFLASAELGDSNAMLQLGSIAENAGDLQEARNWYLRAIEMEDIQAMCNLGLLEHNAGDLVEAKRHYENALTHGEFWPLNNLGRIAELQGDNSSARQFYEKAAKNGDPTAMTNLGILAEEAENIEEATKWYEEAATHDYGDAIFQLGNIASSSGDSIQARTWWEKGAALGHESSIEALELNEQNLTSTDSPGDSHELDDLELDGCQREEWLEVIEAFVSDDEDAIQEIEENYPRTFEAFLKLRECGLFEIWAEWSANLDFGRGEDEAIRDFLSIEILEDEDGNEIDFDGERQRLSVKKEYLPSSDDDRYVFNIEGGVCAISGKPPQLTLESVQAETNSKILRDVSGINCELHESSDDCYIKKCNASLITIDSGLGDGNYRIAAFDNSSGEVECILTYFLHPFAWDYVESKLILGEGTIGTKSNGTLIGNLENHIPIYLGELRSNGTLSFGDRWAWYEAGRGEDYKIASISVPADDYLVLGWIEGLSFDPTNINVFTVGLYRNEMKAYYLNLMEEFPIIKTFAEKHISYNRNLGDE